MKLKEIGALFLLAALFGSSFLFVRIASPVIGPYLTTQGRVTFAALGLFLFLLLAGRPLQFRERWKQYLAIGTLNSAIPFTLVSFASLHLNASLLAIINSFTPLFTALVVRGWTKESLGLRKWAGILMGIAGVAITVGWSPVTLSLKVVIAIACSLLSTVCYGLGGVYAKKTFAEVPSVSIVSGQLMGASVLLLPITISAGAESVLNVPPAVGFSVLGLSLISTGAGYLLYYYLIGSVGPTKTVTVTYLIPLFGIAWGAMFLNESITAGMMAGLMVILISIFLISDLSVRRISTIQKGRS